MPVPFEQSDALAGLAGLRHGFFGRQGGSSAGVFATLNMSESTGDSREAVAGNRARAMATLGFASPALALARQVHSATVVTLAGPPDWRTPPEADALVTSVPGVVLGVLTADCAPILLADPAAGVVGAAHAGWKGAVGGIVGATVDAMVALGAKPPRIVAAVGPTISSANYEVGPEFAADLIARHGDAARHVVRPPGGREHFDLPGFVVGQLRRAGVGSVFDLGLCTYADPARYFSHRRATHEGTTTGRQIALIGRT
ncbi:peptidoglycan editing factor PgeF [Devosia sp.]|uniref:peptidoglycan editing factor PgeF n=1 Tax=Devosia sp. TaxID=1871048 RepID=UPI002F0D9B80